MDSVDQPARGVRKVVDRMVLSLALLFMAAQAEAISYTVDFAGHITQSPAFSGSPDPTPYPSDPGIISVGTSFAGSVNWNTDQPGLSKHTNPDAPGQWIESGQVPFSWRVDMSGRFAASTPAYANAEYLAILGSSPANPPSKFLINLDTRSAVQGNGSVEGNLFVDYWLGNGIAQSARWVEFALGNGLISPSIATWRIGFEDNTIGPSGLGRDLIGVFDQVQFRGRGNVQEIPEPSIAWLLSVGLAGLLALKSSSH
jgi:hypothetical protein